MVGDGNGTVQDLERRFLSGDFSQDNSEITQLQTDVNTLKDQTSTIPTPASMTPVSVALDGARGDSNTYARADHTHAARVQRKILTLDGSGLATWTFTRPFTAEPSLQYMVFQSTGEPIIVEAQTWIMDGSNYTGITIKAYRSRAMPTLTPLNVVTFVLTGVNALFALLSNFNIFQGGGLNGVKVHMSAGDQI